ncbi:MAG: hypothetical protein KGQ46_15295 [Hyphomicrobiales bacterium]|nr:hypothetical protein [Hyphomicrobiales bacterium]
MRQFKRLQQTNVLRLIEPELTFKSCGNGPDLRMVELARLLARRAARELFEEQKKERSTTRS